MLSFVLHTKHDHNENDFYYNGKIKFAVDAMLNSEL